MLCAITKTVFDAVCTFLLWVPTGQDCTQYMGMGRGHMSMGRVYMGINVCVCATGTSSAYALLFTGSAQLCRTRECVPLAWTSTDFYAYSKGAGSIWKPCSSKGECQAVARVQASYGANRRELLSIT